MHDIKADKIQVNSIESLEQAQISSANKITYVDDYTDFEDLELVNKKWVLSQLANSTITTISGDQDSMSGGVGSGYVTVPITGINMWGASYTKDGVTTWINQDQLQDGAIYSFPTDGDFTYTINYINSI